MNHTPNIFILFEQNILFVLPQMLVYVVNSCTKYKRILLYSYPTKNAKMTRPGYAVVGPNPYRVLANISRQCVLFELSFFCVEAVCTSQLFCIQTRAGQTEKSAEHNLVSK